MTDPMPYRLSVLERGVDRPSSFPEMEGNHEFILNYAVGEVVHSSFALLPGLDDGFYRVLDISVKRLRDGIVRTTVEVERAESASASDQLPTFLHRGQWIDAYVWSGGVASVENEWSPPARAVNAQWQVSFGGTQLRGFHAEPGDTVGSVARRVRQIIDAHVIPAPVTPLSTRPGSGQDARG